MFPGMSNDSIRDRLHDGRERDRGEIQSWLDGQGSRVMGVVLILLVVWMIASWFIG